MRRGYWLMALTVIYLLGTGALIVYNYTGPRERHWQLPFLCASWTLVAIEVVPLWRELRRER